MQGPRSDADVSFDRRRRWPVVDQVFAGDVSFANGRRYTIRVEGVPDVTEARKGSIILVVRNDFGVAGRQRTCLSGSASALTRTAVSDLCSSSKSLLSLADFTHEGG